MRLEGLRWSRCLRGEAVFLTQVSMSIVDTLRRCFVLYCFKHLNITKIAASPTCGGVHGSSSF